MRRSTRKPRMGIFASLLALVVGCGALEHKGHGSDGPPIDVGGRPCPEGSTATWENFGEPFLRNDCTGCHSSALSEGERQNAPLTVNFDTYPDVRLHASRIFARAADSNATMPPAGGVTVEDRVRLGDWLACDAPRESGH